MGPDHRKLGLALIGRGKMGAAVEQTALGRGHFIVPVEKADICVDFTHAEAVLENVKRCATLGKNMVIGTTGWEKSLPAVIEIAKKEEIGLLYAPNFSIGMALFKQIVSAAAKLLLGYDVSGIEAHHCQKADIPSGSARALGEALLECRPDKERVVFGNGPITDPAKEIHFPSLRCGRIPGTHTIQFEGKYDSISLTHAARGREGFAEGAVDCAEWLFGKTGIYTLEDMLHDAFHSNYHSV